MTLQPMSRGYMIRGLSFEADGSMAVEYCRPKEDGKLSGVTVNHTLFIDAGGQYDEEMSDLFDAVTALLDDVLEDVKTAEPRPIDVFDEGDDAAD